MLNGWKILQFDFIRRILKRKKNELLTNPTSKDGYQKFMDQHLILKYVSGTGF